MSTMYRGGLDMWNIEDSITEEELNDLEMWKQIRQEIEEAKKEYCRKMEIKRKFIENKKIKTTWNSEKDCYVMEAKG